jgi:tRNA(fMet)-specific endonuclease VapC
MSYALLDTNALSDLIRDHAAIKAQVAAFSGFLETSVIVVGEITYGLNRMPAGKRQADYDQRFRDLISTLSIVPITESVARTYGVIKMSCEKSGITLDENDLWIAATAMDKSATVVTRDQGFSRIPGLRTID